MKRKVSNSEYRLLEKEFQALEQEGHLKADQAKSLLSNYEPTERVSFVRTLLVIGAVLIGVGILSFIAGNWQEMPKLAKFLLLFFATAGFYTAGYKIEDNYPRTSRSFYYIGVFVYGAGVFLVGQMFNLGESTYSNFLMWGLGILPLAYYLKDKLIAIAVAAFFTIYIFIVFDAAVQAPYLMLVLVPLLFWINERRLGGSSLLFIANTIMGLAFIINLLFYFELNELLILIIFFAIGLFLTFYPLGRYNLQSEWIGSLVYGIAGLFLTFPYIWDDVFSNDNARIAAIILQ